MASTKTILPTTREKAPSGNLYDSMVEVKVGKDDASKSFYLHKGLVSFYSGYFTAALKENFAESKQGFIELPSEKAPVFERFVTWLYTNRIDLSKKAAGACYYAEIVALCSFADRRDVPLLMNETIDAIRDEVVRTWRLPSNYLREIYDVTPVKAGLRRIVVHIIALFGSVKLAETTSLERHYFDEVLRDVLCESWRLRDAGTAMPSRESIRTMDLCEYHVHEEGVECKKT